MLGQLLKMFGVVRICSSDSDGENKAQRSREFPY
jgi:hypothetical protein